MRIRSFRSILDECLTALHQGESVEACISRHPRHADRLRPLLTLAQRVSQTPAATPRPWAQGIAWEQVRQRAEDLRSGRRPLLPRISWLRPLAIATSLVLAVLAVTGGLAYAAQGSLPDSPLYRVKLATEDVRLWFVFDEASRANILLDQSNERIEEIMELVQRGKTVPANVLAALRERNERAARILEDQPQETALLDRMLRQSEAQEGLLLALSDRVSDSARDEYGKVVASLHNTLLQRSGAVLAIAPEDLAGGILSISGPAQPFSGSIWQVGGVEVRIDERTIGYQKLRAGRTATFVVARDSNGRLQALSLSTVEDGLPESETLVSGAVEQVTEDEIVVGGQRIGITHETILQLKLEEGRRVEITANAGAEGAVAASVKPTDIDADATSQLTLVYEGVTEGAINTDGDTNQWVIGGSTFIITPATVFDLRGGDIKPGVRAHVEAVSADGQLLAQRVMTLATEGRAESVHLTGVFQGSRDGLWLVSGLEVAPQPGAEAPALGSLVAIDAELRESSMVGRQATVLELPGQARLALLQGLIADIEGDIWTVGFAQVHVGESAEVFGQAIVGARALIWGRQGGVGTLEATYVRVLDQRPIISTEQE